MLMLTAGAGEAGHGAAAVGSIEPFVDSAKLELGKLRLARDEVDGVDECRRIDPVERRTGRSGLDVHDSLLIGLQGVILLDAEPFHAAPFEQAWKPELNRQGTAGPTALGVDRRAESRWAG